MADDGPTIVRPIPRRPFDLQLTSASPPSEDGESRSPSPELVESLSASQFLMAGDLAGSDSTDSLRRPDSYANLTTSTLYGIYSPTSGKFGHDPLDDTDTPWGTGARTPIKRPSVDEVTYELMRDRSHLHRKVIAARPVRKESRSTSSTMGALALRGVVLFILGVGYGALVAHFHQDVQQPLSGLSEDIIRRSLNWKYLMFWGVAGALIGSLLPWFDKVWERMFGVEPPAPVELDINAAARKKEESEERGLAKDWTLVVRVVGAFVGIAFAIRKLVWSSTMQASAAMALANPILWWLIDRSVNGFLFSAGVALAGSIFLLGLSLEMVPAPTRYPLFRNLTSPSDALSHAESSMTLGGLANQETLEAGIWILSILFCSCICFGNIGRRLTWSESARARRRVISD